MKKWLFIICTVVCPLLLWGQNFVYPAPPDSICDRQERINYMTDHFWTEKEIEDTINFRTPKLLLDYLYLLKQTDEQLESIRSFVSLSSKYESTFGLILYWLDSILYDSSSPYYDEAFYLQLMNAVISSEADSIMKLIPLQRVEMLKKNHVGAYANNFLFIDKEGETNCLYEIEAPLLLLVFNNPDCSLCYQTEKSIVNNEKLQSMLDGGKLKLLAVTPDSDYDEWIEYTYPSNWIVGYDKEKTIYNQKLYDIQKLPCIYLLDKDKKVLLKEADYNRLVNYLSANSSLFER